MLSAHAIKLIPNATARANEIKKNISKANVNTQLIIKSRKKNQINFNHRRLKQQIIHIRIKYISICWAVDWAM